MLWLYVGLALAVLLAFLALMWRIGATAGDPVVALRKFAEQRPTLQDAFLAAASASGKPRGLRWKGIEWHDGVTLVRDRADRRLAALVGVTISFEAVEGGDMEGIAAVGNLRHGSAVYFYHRGAWQTTGKALFNLLPDEAVTRFAQQYEPVTPADTR